MIYNFCPFNNENQIAELKIAENYYSGGLTCITEANKTFKYEDKPYSFNVNCDPSWYRYWQIDGGKLFVGKKWMLTRRNWFLTRKVNPWINEATQRNVSANQININDDDIIVLSDVDEIIYREMMPELVELVKKHGIITVPLIFTCFYLNLVCKDWPGPKDYSYRVFLMTGKKFKNLGITSDQLRKRGEAGRLVSEIYCHEKISGFHHSWLGDVDFIARKINSYAHDSSEHCPEIFSSSGEIDLIELKKRIVSGKGIFPGQKLEVDYDLKHLTCVTESSALLSGYFL